MTLQEKIFIISKNSDPQLKILQEIELGKLYNELMAEELLKEIDYD